MSGFAVFDLKDPSLLALPCTHKYIKASLIS
jgi:hypothetical protein